MAATCWLNKIISMSFALMSEYLDLVFIICNLLFDVLHQFVGVVTVSNQRGQQGEIREVLLRANP